MVKIYYFSLLLSFFYFNISHGKENNIYMLDDLKFIKEQIINNHPGIYNDLDPLFKKNFYKSYKIHEQAIESDKKRENQKILIESFVKSFHDGHVYISWNDKRSNYKIIKDEDKFKINLISKNSVLIKLSTFDISANNSQFKAVLDLMKNFRNKDKIIFDLRGNHGGNSFIGSQILNSLFGKEYSEHKRNEMNKYFFVDWRASIENFNYLNNLYFEFKTQFSQESNEAISLKKVIDGMKKSIDDGKIYYRELHEHNDINVSNKNNLLKSNLFAIIDKDCASACLDFIDEIKSLHNSVYLIGQTTNADRFYMEIRPSILPSGLGIFWFPMKVYRNRIRKDNAPYYPDINYPVDTTMSNNLIDFIDNLKIY